MPSTATATCERCNGSGEYHGHRRDGSSYVGRCFACQGYRPAYHTGTYRRPAVAVAPVVPVTITPNMAAFQTRYPAEFAWLQANSAAGVEFASSLLAGMNRYGGLTPRQLAAVQRNIERAVPVADEATTAQRHLVDANYGREPVADLDAQAGFLDPVPARAPILSPQAADNNPVAIATMTAPTPIAPTIDMSRIFAAFDTAAASGLRKVRLTLGNVEFKRSKYADRSGLPSVLCYHNGTYVGTVNRFNVFSKGRYTIDSAVDAAIEAFRLAATDPQAAARTHGHDTGFCSCCRRLLTDPPSVMAGIGPICQGRFGWSF